MENHQAASRAKLSGKLTNALDARTLASSNPGLAEVVRAGMAVLDVGCGTGAITRGIAEAVGPQGSAVGFDNDPALIARARSAHGGVPGLAFEVGDVYSLPYEERFDIAAGSRLFVWLADPLQALLRMRAAVRIGGLVVATDYNHEKIRWEPEPPASMREFYSAYLSWRADAGFDNAIADRLPELLRQAGLERVRTTPRHETAVRGEPGFEARIALWADTASSRGARMARDGYISKARYEQAESEYREWIRREARSMTMYMLTAEGVRTS
ncbi:hypothetical protein J19TS2_35570 [Cohnella xylanilytica]|uniref:methyltransferase domain-containing protein n=1 Tax=Cohnella xylanilytica TaxID=557555 RepID=UPI001B2885FF|nr:methyltransferase domain-containing protein [Cohnella xylanilytica]GIO14002.1 hypothetical protein J19TS2_35570 [Cohnella xylanilytica]